MRKLLRSLAVAALLSAPALAKNPTSYQVTGTVTDVGTDNFTLQKKVGAKTETWEIAKGTAMNAASLKKGDQATVKYTMTAQTIDVKGAKAPAKAETSTKTETTTTKSTSTTPAPGK